MREVPDQLTQTMPHIVFMLHRKRFSRVWKTHTEEIVSSCRSAIEEQHPCRLQIGHSRNTAEENLVGIDVLQMCADVRIGANGCLQHTDATFLWRCCQIPKPEFGMWVHQPGSTQQVVKITRDNSSTVPCLCLPNMNLDPVVVPQGLPQNGVHLTRSLKRSDNVNVVVKRQKTF